MCSVYVTQVWIHRRTKGLVSQKETTRRNHTHCCLHPHPPSNTQEGRRGSWATEDAAAARWLSEGAVGQVTNGGRVVVKEEMHAGRGLRPGVQ